MKITTGIEKEPYFIVLYGTEGIGKTGFAADAPAPVFLDPEAGSKKYNVARDTSVRTFPDVMNAILYLKKESHSYKTLVIDSLDHIEHMVWAHTVAQDRKAETIEDVGGGFQKGYGFALEHWRSMINLLKSLRAEKKMNIICIAHSKIVSVNDPTKNLPYDRYTLKLHENKQHSANALWKESVDAVLFATYDDTVFKVSDKDKKAKVMGGTRKLYTTRQASFDAKNRLGLPDELPLSFSAFAEAAERGQPDSKEHIEKDLKETLALLSAKDPGRAEKMAKACADANGDIAKLINIRNYARELVDA